MAPRNQRVTPDTDVRSPARSFAQSLDNFYSPARDTRKEQAFQRGINAFSGILQQEADQMKQERNADEHTQGVQDALREQAGEELKGVKTGSIFRQHSRFYMAGLNETRGKAAAAKWKAETALAYEEWAGKHTDDDGSAFREWMNDRVNTFMGTLGDDQYKVAGALPVINEVATNFATQHTGFTANRLETESMEAYDTIVAGVFDDLSNGDLDLEMAVDAIAFEADSMYDTDGAAANDRVVTAAIQYANIHNDPDAIIVLAKAHDSGKLKLSVANQERLANAMDAVEADIERETSKRAAQDTAAEKARRKAVLNEWGTVLQEDPYAELPTFTEVGDQQTYREMVTLQDAFIKSGNVENPTVTNTQRMKLETELWTAGTAGEKIGILNQFVLENPGALSSSDVASYSKRIFEAADPGSIVNNPTVAKYRTGFGSTLAEFQLGDGFDINRSSYLKTQGQMHFDDFMLANAGNVDMNDPRAIRDLVNDAKEYSMEQLAFDFPEVLREKNDQSPLGNSLGVDDALGKYDEAASAAAAKQAEEAAAFYASAAGLEGKEPTADPLEAKADEPVETVPEGQELPIEEQPTPFEDADSDEEYPPVRAGFYGQMIQRFTDGKDSRELRMEARGVLKDDPEFHQEVERVADKFDLDPKHLLAVMNFETGGTFDPREKNKAGSGATGLIQFMPKTARALGTTTEELARMSRSEQMHYVEKYLDQFPGVQGGDVDDVYMAVLWPKAVGKPDGYPIFRKGTIAYQQNAGLDTNGDGTVTKFEAASKVRRRFFG